MRSDFRDYLRYADKYLAMAEEAVNRHENAEWLLIPAIMLAWSAIECFVNNRCSDLSSVPSDMFQLHERAFLLEKRVRFKDSGSDIGTFVLEGQEYQTLENKIFFLLSKSGSKKATGLKGGRLWDRFQTLKDIRDSLAHPRRDKQPDLCPEDVKSYIETARELIQEISLRIWKTRLDL